MEGAGGGGVVDDEETGHEAEGAESGEHCLVGGEDAVVPCRSLSRRSDRQDVGKRDGEAMRDDRRVGAVTQYDIDLIYALVLPEQVLGRWQVHDRELPAEGGRHALGLEEP